MEVWDLATWCVVWDDSMFPRIKYMKENVWIHSFSTSFVKPTTTTFSSTDLIRDVPIITGFTTVTIATTLSKVKYNEVLSIMRGTKYKQNKKENTHHVQRPQQQGIVKQNLLTSYEEVVFPCWNLVIMKSILQQERKCWRDGDFLLIDWFVR